MSCTNAEYFNMLMCLGSFAIPRGTTVPSEHAFQRLHNRIYTTGSVHGSETHHADTGRPRINMDIEEQVLELFNEDPTRSTRSVARQLGTNHVQVWKVLKEDGQHTFHYRRVQTLLPSDYEPRVEYCAWILRTIEEDAEFLKRVIFTDECSFHRTGVFEGRNEHVWSTLNPYAIKSSHFQHRWRINVWAGILGDQIIGPIFLNETMNEPNYLSFLLEDLDEALEDLDVAAHRSMWFQHDGAPPHFSRAVRDYLNQQYGQQWIGRGGPISWPARSPDLTPLDFYLLGHVKQLVFMKICDTEAETRGRIVAAFEKIKLDTNVLESVRDNLLQRCQAYISRGGRHMEQHLHHSHRIGVLIE